MRSIPPEQALAHPARALLASLIRSHPGISKSDLSDILGIQTSSLLWHIRKLEAARLVTSTQIRRLIVYAPTSGGAPATRLARQVGVARVEPFRSAIEQIASTASSIDIDQLAHGRPSWLAGVLAEEGLVTMDGDRIHRCPDLVRAQIAAGAIDSTVRRQRAANEAEDAIAVPSDPPAAS